MKYGFRRWIAALLLVCTLASFVVPATFADTEGTSTVVDTYDMVLADHEDSKIASTTSAKNRIMTDNCKCKCGRKIYQHIAAMYEEDTLNWCVLATTDTQLTYRSDVRNYLRITDAGSWAAIKVEVSQSGSFVLKNTIDPSKATSKYMTAYAFPASAIASAQDLETAIEAQMTDANNLGKVKYDANGVMTFAEKAYTAGEYVLVLEATGAVYLNELTLSGTVASEETTPSNTEITQATTGATTLPQETEPTNQLYLISVYEDPAYAPMITNDNGVLTNRAYTKTCYDCGKTITNCLASHYSDLNWALEGSSFKELMFLGDDYQKFGYGGLRMRYNKETGEEQTGDWVAFRIKVKSAGLYAVAIGKDYPIAYQADMYIFPAEAETTTDSLTAAMTGANKIGKVEIGKNERTYQAGYKEFDTAGEYILVLKNTGDSQRIYLNVIGLLYMGEVGTTVPSDPTEATTEAPTQPEETTQPTTGATTPPQETEPGQRFHIALYEDQKYASMFLKNGEVANKTYTASCGHCDKTIANCILSRYADLNWYMEGTSFKESTFLASDVINKSSGGGLRLRYNEVSGEEQTGDWVAFRVNVLEAGTYNVKVKKDYRAAYNADLFIFPAAAEAMSDESLIAGMIEANKVGAINFSTSTKEREAGQWNFATAGEYIIVLKNTGDSKRIYVNEIFLGIPGEEKPDTTCGNGYTAGLYNFALYTEESRKPSFKKDGEVADLIYTNRCATCGETLRACFKNQYQTNNLNWVLEGTSYGEIRILAATAEKSGYGGLRFRFDTDENGKIIYVTDEDGKKSEKETGGLNWAAFRVKVNTAGTYTVTLNRDYPTSTTYDLYIIPAETATMSKDSLIAAMTEENLAGAAKITSTGTSAEVGEWAFENAGEYIFLLRTTGSTKRMYLNSITLTVPVEDQPIPAVKEKIYDFNLPAMDELLYENGLTGRYNNNREVRVDDVIEKMYKADQIQWMYENKSAELSINTLKFVNDSLRFKSKTNVRDLENQWISYRIKNPGTDTYDVRLVSSDASKVCANIYLIPAPSEFTMTRAEIQAAMTEENLLVKGAIIEDKGTFYLGEYTFGVNEEYILVFEFTKGTFLYLNQIIMTQDGILADTTVKKQKVYNGTVYDFDMGDSMDGIFSKSNTYANKVIDTLNNMWYSGKLNWKWEKSSDELLGTTKETLNQLNDLTRFYRATGMRIYAKVNYWSAFRIKSPGSGTFTLSLNHAIGNTGGTLAVYILPGDTEDIEKAVDHSNRVGLVALYNDGTSGTKDGYHSYLGHWDFEAGKEYIVVLEAYENSPYSNYCYMNISQLICERGKIDFAANEKKKINPVFVTKNVVPSADTGGNCLVTEIGGHDYYFLPLEGGSMLVYDLDTKELVDKVNTGYPKCYGIDQAPDGTIWLSGDSKYLIHYDPVTKKATKTAEFTSAPGLEGSSGSRGLYVHDDGIVYFGTYHDAQFASYDPETMTYTVYGDIVPELDRIMGIIHHNGYLYMSAYDNGSNRAYVGKFNISTGKVEATTFIEEVTGLGVNYLRMLGDGDLLVGGYSGTMRGFLAIDPNTMEIVQIDLPAGINQNATEEINGKHYMVLSGYGLYQYDIATKEFSIVPGIASSASVGFKMPNNVVTVEGETVLMTNSNSAGGAPRFYNLETREITNWLDLVVHGDGGADILNMFNGPKGSNEIHVGVFNVSQSGLINTETDEFLGRYKTGGQGDSGICYNDKLYYGNYSSTTLNEIYIDRDNLMTTKPSNEVIQRWKLNHEETGQKRVHSLAAGDGYVFAGTIPDSGQFGGAIVVYDTRTGRWYYERNVIQDQAPKSVAYADKILYAGTTISGGTSTTATPPAESAVIFAYDYEKRELLGVLDPRDYISGLTKNLGYIAGVEADPVVEGRLWAVVSETLIAFTFDRETKKFDVQQVISFSKGAASESGGRPRQDRNILFDVDRNYIYFAFDTNGGMQCIEIEDLNAPLGSIKVKNNTRIMSALPTDYALSEQGNLYFASGGSVKMLPCNVAEEEWAIAGKVDDMILAIDSNVTLESEAAIKSARSAYDNLSLRYKALIQELDELQELEVDLLECQIDAIEMDKVTADSLSQMQEYVDTYDGMTARYQKYVKNYDKLQEAYIKATGLNDERLAADMQKRINALKDRFPLTLDDEPDVVALRTEYDGMTVGQRVLIDTAILEDAEAQIKVLRAELIKYVEELIQAIPKEITLDDETTITKAREYADKLYVNERKQVSYTKLTSAEGKLRTLKKAKASAEEVDALIDAIGIVTLGDKERIAEAREAYDALKDVALQFVTKAGKLKTAEFILKALQTWGIPAITVVNAGIVFAVLWFVPSLHSKVFRTKKKEQEVIDK